MKINIYLPLSVLMLTIGNLNGQIVTEAQLSFLKDNTKNITANESSSDSVWAEVVSDIGDKRFILIGEFNHGSKEVFELRNEFIKYLNKNHEFDVILFESGLGELIYPDFNKDKLSAEQMTAGFFGGWRTKEFRLLMEYVQSEDIAIAGFDVQRTGNSFKKLLRKVAKVVIKDSLNYIHLEKKFSILRKELPNRKIAYSDSLSKRTQSLINDYEKVYTQILNTEKSVPLKKSMFILKAIENRIAYLNYMLDFKKTLDWNKRWAIRDSLMAENIIWLSENIYRNKKIIIVAHNFHISKYNEREEVMGAFLKKKYPNDMYAIGVYARAGKYLGNYGTEEEMTPADEQHLDIKHIIHQLDYEKSFIHIPTKILKGGEWLHHPIVINDTFIDLSSSNTLILSKHYDGLFLLKNISLPED